MTINIDQLQTLAVAILVLFVGAFIIKRVQFLRNYNIPEPVVGGILFAVLSGALHTHLDIDLSFDASMRTPFMLAFFTTIGLAASFKLLAQGGPRVLLFLAIATVFLILQNGLGIVMALSLDQHPLLGLLAGSITLSGGHGTGAAYAESFANSHNLQGAMELAMACATFGLIIGGVLGGPVAQRLLSKRNLRSTESEDVRHPHEVTYKYREEDRVTPEKLLQTLFIIVVCLVGGGVLGELFKDIGLTLPTFIWSLFLGIIIMNVCEQTGIYEVHKESVDLLGTVSLSLFLAMSLMSLRLWELVNLAGPLLTILAAQTVMLAAYAYFVTFNVMGKNYDSAIMSGGHCGFGMGATPTAVANMEALVSRYGPSPAAFLVVPMVGAFFIDLTNALVIQGYLALPIFGQP